MKTSYSPWRGLVGWVCLRCGKCCREYAVPLTRGEAIRYTLKYGSVVIPYRNKSYLMRKLDGSCCFLVDRGSYTECSIYYDRPLVCKLYPFYITTNPLPNIDEDLARYNIGNKNYVYVYLDSTCPGVNKTRNISIVVRKAVELWLRYKVYRVFK